MFGGSAKDSSRSLIRSAISFTFFFSAFQSRSCNSDSESSLEPPLAHRCKPLRAGRNRSIWEPRVHRTTWVARRSGQGCRRILCAWDAPGSASFHRVLSVHQEEHSVAEECRLHQSLILTAPPPAPIRARSGVNAHRTRFPVPARLLLRGDRKGRGHHEKQAPPAAGFLKFKRDPDEDRKLWRGITSAEPPQASGDSA